MEKIKNKAPYVGMIIGLIAIILGVLVLLGVFTNSSEIYFPSSSYDYGYAQFGSDYYSYTNNNMAYAACAAKAAASRVKHLTELVTSVAGFSFILIGAFISCLFATKIPCSMKKSNDANLIVETPIEPTID